jgi:hypothetical protein
MTDGALVTPPFLLPLQARLTFWHWIDAEVDGSSGRAWGSGLVMISSPDGEWHQVTPEGGYPYLTSSSVSSPYDPETPCFSGSHGWEEATFDLSAYSGVVQLVFRFGTNWSEAGEGWYIDDVTVESGGCCGAYRDGYTGNANCSEDGLVTLADITTLIDHVYLTKEELCCPENGNTNGSLDGLVTLADITGLIDHVYLTKSPTAPCP